MKISCALTVDDCIAARWLALKPRQPFRALLGVISVLYVVTLGIELHRFFTTDQDKTNLLILVGAGGYIGFLFFVLLPRRIRKIFAEQKSLREPAELEFTDEGMAGSCASGTFKIAWSDVFKWTRNHAIILIYESSALMRIIPLRALGNTERNALFALMETHLGPPKP